jgi:hypothetical protein
MGLLRAGGRQSSWIPFYTGLQIQTSSTAVPISIVYGTNRVAPNVTWTGGFFAVAQYAKSGGSGGGKGGGKQLQGYEYYTSFTMGICEGPISGYGTIFSGQNIYSSFWVAQYWYTGIDFATLGTTPQSPWSFLQSAFPSQALNYNGLAYIGSIAYDLGQGANLPQFSFEIRGVLFNSSGVNGYDADPALIIQDFLTNAQYGVLFPAASIDATTLLGSSGGSSYQTYCQASYLALSPALTNQESANSILARWLKLTNSAGVWSGGKLKFIPYGDSSVTRSVTLSGITSNVTFNPNVTPVYNLADDDFIHEDGKDPIEIVRSDPFSTYNWQRLQISARGNYYDSTPIDVFDQNAIELYGLRIASDITASEITDPLVGQISAQLILQRGLYIRNIYKFKLSFEYCLLDPMDLVTVTDAALGLNNVAIRITEIEEDDSGILAITAEKFPGGTASAVQYPVQGGGGNPTNQSVIPARVNAPIIYEPPAALTGGNAQVWVAVSGGVAPVYKLAETAVTSQHLTQLALVAAQSVTTPTTVITFSIYAQAAGRTTLRLNFDNGSGTPAGCDFNLVTAAAGTPDTGITSATIQEADGGWYQCTITGPIVGIVTPNVYVLLESTFGSVAPYLGIAGDGIYVWGAEFSTAGESPTLLPVFSSATGATIGTIGSPNPPQGVAGNADANWGGAYVWISTDGNNYGQIGQVTAPARQGVLTAPLPAFSGANPDTADTLSINLIESGGTLSSVSPSDAQNGITLCLINDSMPELLSYETATLTGTNAYNLRTLYRGFYGTSPNVSHSSGAPFTYVDGAIFKYSLPAAYVGVLIYMKFQSFNIFGQAVEDLSECQVYTYTPNGSGQGYGPITQALILGQNIDFGAVSIAVNESDDWGLASATSIATIALGTSAP